MKTAQIIKMDLLALDLKNLNPNVMLNPRAAPNASDPIISTSGQTKTSMIFKVVFPANAFEIENKIAKAISATASSKATTGINVSTTGPFALYCFMTINVAAGAVAHAIAPKVKIKEIGN